MNVGHEMDAGIVLAAANGKNGPDQQRIAEVGLAWLSTILRKNQDYGSSAWQVPVLAPGMNPGDAILVRMSDKISRLQRLLAGGTPNVSDESASDTMQDLGAYSLLWLARPVTSEGPGLQASWPKKIPE